ncbi:choline dehydrogenase-like flavoprotein [Pedobacter cryoconitis]|uniref:GMC oxidoreductase n=1 Tax=Pedobacter cryoconitis TaxID=188932 RepID=UPI00161F743A|nr:GMC oxidoreductase [Pedobacter cryoconitis]MBB6269872.1 choline dehydrogenase-like flavoprotein [Pedobacter cryoconitis]
MKYNYYDLIVAGTGFASTFFLKKYLDKNKGGKRVLVLEKGQLFPHAERLKIKRGEHSDFSGINDVWEEKVININKEKKWPFTTGFGGSSNCWWGCTPRFMPSDFKMKTLFGVENDWPVSYEELDPYYEEAEVLMSISGPEGTPFPRKGKYPLPPHTFTAVDKILHQKYGNLYISQPTARASRAVQGGRNACMTHSACDVCAVDAKFTIENSNINVYNNEQVELVYGAEVYSLETVGNVAKKVNYVKDGKDFQISGEVIILGANPIFNSNILLNSGDKNPLTGKGFGEQLGMQVLIYLDNMNNKGGSTWVNANGYMLYDGDHRKDYAACLIEVNNAPYNIRLERGKWLNMASFRMIFEDLPLLTNYISTSANKLVPEIHFKGRSDYAIKGVENMKKVLPGILSCLPVEKLKYLDPFPNEGHIIGGTRMGQSAADSVVDKNMIHHQYRNVFVLGSGSFTTFSASNPTLTLAALSLYSADHSF